MLVEAGVLDVDLGVAHVRRHLVGGQDGAVALVDLRDQAALGVEDLGGLGERWGLEVVGNVVEALRRALGGQSDATGDGQGEACQQYA